MAEPGLAAVRLAAPPAAPVATIEWSKAADVAVAVLLPVEILGLTVAFDASRLVGLPAFWARLLVLAPQALRLAGTIAVALVIIDGRRLLAGVRTAARPDGRARATVLALHLAAIAAFAGTSAILLDGNVAAVAHRPAWTIAWVLLGGATAASWALALFPLRVWTGVLRPDAGHAAMAALAGGLGWGAGFVTQEFWTPMAALTFRVVAWLVRGLYSHVIVDPGRLTVGTPAFGVIISPACSGYEGIGLLVAFLSIYLWMFRQELRFPAALFLLPLGAITIWIVNALRIVALIAIGSSGWPGVAAGGFHSEAGWIAFNATALGFVALGGRLAGVAPARAREAAPAHHDATIALLAPFVAVGLVGMIGGAFSAGFDWLYPARVVVAALVLWRFRRQYPSLRWSRSWWPIGVGVAVCAIWLPLASASLRETSLWSAALHAASWRWAALWMAFRVVGFVVMTPLIEELAFRAYLMRRLQAARIDDVPIGQFSWLSWLGSSLAFGALHGSMWVAGTIAGMAFAVALCRRRMLGDAVVAHGIANGLLAAYACVSGHWSVWS